MITIKEERKEHLLEIVKTLGSDPVSFESKFNQLISQIDSISRSSDGLIFLYKHIETFDKTGFFRGTPWEEPKSLSPVLVRGTLCASPPDNIMEIVSELRMLKIAKGEYSSPQINVAEAHNFLENAVVATFDLALGEGTSATRVKTSPGEMERIRRLFALILEDISVSNVRKKLLEEVEAVANQRPIITYRLEAILRLVKEDKVQLDSSSKESKRLEFYVNALYNPTPKTKEADQFSEYISQFSQNKGSKLIRQECVSMGEKLHNTGLVSLFHLEMLKYLMETNHELIPTLLHLNDSGRAEFRQHHDFVIMLIKNFILETNKQAVYGLKEMLERSLLSRMPVWNALSKLAKINIHPEVAKRLKKSSLKHKTASAKQLLVGGTISILGQPLGIGQGDNPTCQSARGISMWSEHSPGKLLNMIIDAAVTNRLEFRYEGQLISSQLPVNIDSTFDYNLDPVSVLLVPLLDSIYIQMMKTAPFKHIGEDPHVSVNPAFYGNWIQTGFISCYNNLTYTIERYDRFVRIFFSSFHPRYNGGHNIIYPIPLGIFITNSKGQMLGFHAVSLLRVSTDPTGEWRAYFFNPNNDGRQDWGQSIVPTVSQNGEMHGESSLPFHQFASRVYAFHYNNSNNIEEKEKKVPERWVQKVEALAKASWGEKYVWS